MAKLNLESDKHRFGNDGNLFCRADLVRVYDGMTHNNQDMKKTQVEDLKSRILDLSDVLDSLNGAIAILNTVLFVFVVVELVYILFRLFGIRV